MDWLTFVSKLVDSLAWPATVAFAVYQLRDKLGELLPRLRKIKHKDTELEFAELVEELVQEKAAEPEEPATPRSAELDHQFQFLMNLAEIHPRSAVLESFRTLETAAAKRAAELHPEAARSARSPLALQKMLKGEVLGPDGFHQFNQLRRLRNEAAHAEDFDIRGMPVEAYVDIALSLAARIERSAA